MTLRTCELLQVFHPVSPQLLCLLLLPPFGPTVKALLPPINTIVVASKFNPCRCVDQQRAIEREKELAICCWVRAREYILKTAPLVIFEHLKTVCLARAVVLTFAKVYLSVNDAARVCNDWRLA